MTGEITLRGQVLPVGGIKEKVIAAHRSGLKSVILPIRNKPDLDDLPDEVRNSLHFVFAETVDDVLAAALEPAPKAMIKKRRVQKNISKGESGAQSNAR
jgi:ATP-dependent Lon protease